jgi:hypothetical protein
MKEKNNVLPYEEKIFSQHREDGIIQKLLSFSDNQNKIAVEIGSGNGQENMIKNLVVNHGFIGYGHDLQESKFIHKNYYHRVGLVTLENLSDMLKTIPTMTPSFFSLDIDSYDFWIMKSLLKDYNFRPSIICAEYLCYFGDSLKCAVKYGLSKYSFKKCGSSLAAYQELLLRYNYKFFTCDTRGVNSFFYLAESVEETEEFTNLPRHKFTFMPKYKHLTNIDLNDPMIEFDEKRLFE